MEFENYYFDIVRPLGFLRFSNTVSLTERLLLDVRGSIYWASEGLRGGPFPYPQGRVLVALVNIGLGVAFRL